MSGTKRAINLTLDEALVREARDYTPNISATLERLLGEFVVRERGRRREEDRQIDQLIETFDALHATTGLLSDEYCAL